MDWTKPPESKGAVVRAGDALRASGIRRIDPAHLAVINQWRAAHSFPLNTFQVELRRRSKQVCSEKTVAQRIKRLESVHAKLVDKPSMRLTQMQDIGGCRAVVNTVKQLRALVTGYKTASSRLKHTFHHEKNYVLGPKPDGYRSCHLIYQYSSPRTPTWDGLFIEVQARTRFQHAWATAVETVDTFTGQGLKKQQGNPAWTRFFALVSTAIAALEGCPSVANTETRKALLIEEIGDLERDLNVIETLMAHQRSIDVITNDNRGDYYVIEMNYDKRTSVFTGFKSDNLSQAQDYAAEREAGIRESDNVQVVLVKAGSIKALKRAYPNYILDTTIFTTLLEEWVLKGEFPNPRPEGLPSDA